MALYDAREKKKISENFYFDVTPEQIKKMLGGHIPYQDVSTLSRSCVFSLSNVTPDVFIVVKVSEKIYCHLFEHFAKTKAVKNKDFVGWKWQNLRLDIALSMKPHLLVELKYHRICSPVINVMLDYLCYS